MIEVKIPKEIKEYKETFLFGLTVKKFVCLAVALACGIPLYVFGKNIMPEELVSWAVILVVAPILGIGFVSFHNMSFFQLCKRLFFMTFCSQKRKYYELPVFWYAREQIIKEELLLEKEKNKLYLAEKNKINKAKFKKYVLLSENRKGASSGKEKRK